MRWRGSQFHRWIAWLKSLLKVRDRFDPELMESPSIEAESLPGAASTRKRRVASQPQSEARSLRKSSLVSEFRKGPQIGLLTKADATFRRAQLRGILQPDRTLARTPDLNTTGSFGPRPANRTKIRPDSRLLRGNTSRALRTQQGRNRILDELKAMVDSPPKSQPKQVQVDPINPKSATFSPPFKTPFAAQPRERKTSAKPGREPPLWLSLGPNLARQFKK